MPHIVVERLFQKHFLIPLNLGNPLREMGVIVVLTKHLDHYGIDDRPKYFQDSLPNCHGHLHDNDPTYLIVTDTLPLQTVGA